MTAGAAVWVAFSSIQMCSGSIERLYDIVYLGISRSSIRQSTFKRTILRAILRLFCIFYLRVILIMGLFANWVNCLPKNGVPQDYFRLHPPLPRFYRPYIYEVVSQYTRRSQNARRVARTRTHQAIVELSSENVIQMEISMEEPARKPIKVSILLLIFVTSQAPSTQASYTRKSTQSTSIQKALSPPVKMHAINILNLILAGISLVSTSPTPSPFNPSRAHFASEDINKAAPFYDLSAFGVHTGQLPRVYDISTGNFTYLPDASYDMFLEVKAGLRNLTAPAPVAETGGIEKRVCESIHFYVFGSCGAFQTTVSKYSLHASTDLRALTLIRIFFRYSGNELKPWLATQIRNFPHDRQLIRASLPVSRSTVLNQEPAGETISTVTGRELPSSP